MNITIIAHTNTDYLQAIMGQNTLDISDKLVHLTQSLNLLQITNMDRSIFHFTDLAGQTKNCVKV